MYDGSDWTPLGTGVDSYVRAIHEYNGNLIVGGDFNTASGTSANKIAKWNPNSSTWSAMGTGMNGYVKSASVYNGTFYAGGDFTTADGLSRDFIASWYETPSVPPVANMNSSANSACAGSCISFSDNSSNSPASWTWSFPGATVTSSSAQNSGSICYSAAGNYTVTLEACNSSGCDITTQNITINSTPSVSFVNQTICEGETAILTASPSTGGGSFVWTPGGATTQTISVNPSVTTNYSVTYTLNGCVSAAFNGSVTVNEVPTLTVTSGTTICSGNSVNLTATPSLAGGNFSWSPGGQTSGSVLVSPSSNTTYVVSYELNGCSAADASTTINVNTTPTLIVSDQTICNGSTATLSATPSSGGGSFLWSPGGETTSSIDVSPTATSNYSVVYTLNACPSTTENATVTVIAAPDVTINDAIICEGEDITISAVISDAGGAYFWSPGGETSSSITVFPSSDITYTVTYTITGCPPATDDAVITVNETPTVTVNDELICAGETANLIANPSISGGTFLWSPGGETTNTIDVSPVASDSYSVVYTLNGCESNAAVSSVTVNPMPDNSVLQNGFELSAVQNSATYQWLDCALYIPVSGATSQSFTPSSNGSYAVEINLNGCVDTSDCNVVAGLGTENQLLPSLLLYPNPANDVIHVIGSENALGYRILDLQGKILLQGVLYDVITPINIEHLADGIYILETSGWSLQTIQFVKQ
ncbi:MAG: PKD domain-containing protein [Crocinitomicaceae bacterium]|nr:PKD domain-containing protein [Crocinitomicaceae bacterium]